jgi:DNA primase
LDWAKLFEPETAIPQIQVFTLPLSLPLTERTEENAPGYDYVLGRGVKPEYVQKYDLRYSPTMARVIIPVYDGLKRCVGYQARDITGQAELKILSPKGFDKSKALLGYWQAIADRAKSDHPRDSVVLVEGPFDLLKVAELDGALCSFGKNVSKQQIQLIRDLNVKRVYLGLDPDAMREIKKYAALLEPAIEAWVIQPPPNQKDFGDCSYEEVQAAKSLAKRYSPDLLVEPRLFQRNKWRY